MESITRQNMKLSPRIVRTNPVNGLVHITVPAGVQDFFVQLLNHVGKRSDYFATCITCLHWKDHPEFSGKQCSLFNCIPPPEVIANGCEHYEDADIVPF